MTDAELSVLAGKSPNYLSYIKYSNKEKYEYMKKHGIKKYEHDFDELKIELQQIYFELLETRKLADFYKTTLTDIFESYTLFYNVMAVRNFTVHSRSRWFDVFKQNLLIKERYLKYKEQNNDV